MLSCSLATSAYEMLDSPGASAGWSLVLPWLGWVFSLFVIPIAVARLLGVGMGSNRVGASVGK